MERLLVSEDELRAMIEDELAEDADELELDGKLYQTLGIIEPERLAERVAAGGVWRHRGRAVRRGRGDARGARRFQQVRAGGGAYGGA